MDFKEFLILSESVGPNELEKAWKDQGIMKRMVRRMTRANYPDSQKGTTALPGREVSNMNGYLDDLMGADHWNGLSISTRLQKIKDVGGNIKAANAQVSDFMLKVARGDYSEEMAVDILNMILDRHLKNADRDAESKPRWQIPVSA